jgi:ABC-type sugar transport system ATPase subunit
MSFENYGLYPHMTVFQNIAYPLRVHRRPPDQVDAAVMQIARVLQIEDVLEARPAEVGVGVQQRVSLARALVRKPAVFLLDEPLSHLDADLRSQMRGELKRLQKLGSGATMVYVTHDQLEAMTMADRIAVMSEGRLQQVGTPDEVFHAPANRFVASFIGEPAMNLLTGTVEAADGGARVLVDGVPILKLAGGLARTLLDWRGAGEGGVQLGVRPTDAQLAPPGEPGLPVRVRVREFMGERVAVIVEGPRARLRVLGRRAALPFAAGEGAVFRARPERVHFFSATTGEAIGRATR